MTRRDSDARLKLFMAALTGSAIAGVVLLGLLYLGSGSAQAQGLTPETNVTGGLEDPADVEVSWSPINPKVWVRDLQEGQAGGGAAFRYSEKLTDLEQAQPLCQGEGLENTVTRVDGLTLSVDQPARVAWECAEKGTQARFIERAGSDGNARGSTPIPGAAETRLGMSLDARNLNNVTYVIPPDDSGLLDLPNRERRWARTTGPSFVDAAIEVNQSRPATTCFTGIFGGTRCYADDGNALSRRDTIRGAQIDLRDGVVWVLERDEDPTQLHQMDTFLEVNNSVDAPGGERPMAVSKTGRLLVYENRTGGNTTGNITLRDAETLEWLNNSRPEAEGGPASVRSLAWHPRDEGFYALTPNRLHFYNTTAFKTATGGRTTDGTTVRDAGAVEPEPPGLINLTRTGNALGIAEDQVGLFWGALLMASMAAGLGAALREAGQLASTLAAGIGGAGGATLAFVFDWFPFWVLFTALIAVATITGVAIRRRAVTGNNDAPPGPGGP